MPFFTKGFQEHCWGGTLLDAIARKGPFRGIAPDGRVFTVGWTTVIREKGVEIHAEKANYVGMRNSVREHVPAQPSSAQLSPAPTIGVLLKRHQYRVPLLAKSFIHINK